MELLHTSNQADEENFVPIDEWDWNEVDHLATMGFSFDGEYHMRLKSPKMAIYKKNEGRKKDPLSATNKEEETPFYLEDPTGKHKFRNFHQLMSFFDTYEQKDLNKHL